MPPTITSPAGIKHAQRVVVKVGSSTLTGPDGHLDEAILAHLVDTIVARYQAGTQVVLVTSGAISSALGPLRLARRPKDLATQQASASVGQGLLIARYAREFAGHGLSVGQVLLTLDDIVRRRHYTNAQRALGRLLELGVVPIVNENDAVATDEIRFGDNDRLAAIACHLVKADALILVSDVDALYDRPPRRAGAQRITRVNHLDEVEAFDITARGSEFGSGGMATKIESVRIATSSGIPVVLTNAAGVAAALGGQDVGTFFAAAGRRVTTRSLWIAYAARARGVVTVDAGAVAAIAGRHTSLLPAGITGVSGTFDGGDVVEIHGPQGLVGRGVSTYSSSELPGLIGQRTFELRKTGNGRDRVAIHADDLVIRPAVRAAHRP